MAPQRGHMRGFNHQSAPLHETGGSPIQDGAKAWVETGVGYCTPGQPHAASWVIAACIDHISAEFPCEYEEAYYGAAPTDRTVAYKIVKSLCDDTKHRWTVYIDGTARKSFDSLLSDGCANTDFDANRAEAGLEVYQLDSGSATVQTTLSYDLKAKSGASTWDVWSDDYCHADDPAEANWLFGYDDAFLYNYNVNQAGIC